MKYSTLFFDLDGTLYSQSTGLWGEIRTRMDAYMHQKMGLPRELIPNLRRRYFEQYGTTLRGLQHHYNIDSDEYLAYVHDLPLHAYLKPDPGLRWLLESLRQPKWIFTNADRQHAQRVMEILQVADCFEGVIDVRRLEFNCKPNPDVYHRALEIAGESSAEHSVFFEDSPRNLTAARALGFFTVLVGGEPTQNCIDLEIENLNQLPQRFPELWH
jgi:putative hydrolase of the HAD superfamily